MLNNKIKYILVLFIILCLSMNAFSAINITEDSNDAPLQSSDSVDIVADDSQNGNQDDNQNGNQGADLNGSQDDNQNGNNQNNNGCTTDSDNSNNNNNKPTFNFNTTGGGSYNRSGSSFNISDILSKFLNMGNNSTNDTTNDTNNTIIIYKIIERKVSDVPEVVTHDNYEPVSYPTVEKISQHVMKRARDNKIISQGDTLRLGDINKLYDSDFTNGHLLVYVDGKLVFNEITADDLSTPILGITDDLVGQHELSVEFTSNADSNSNTNKYTENIIVE